MSSSILDVLEHHGSELVVGDLTVTVLVDLLDDHVDDVFVEVLSEREHLLYLVGRYGTTTVLVEHLESRLQFVIAQQVLLVHRGYHEFRVVDFSTAVSINLCKHLIDLFVRQSLSEELSVTVFDFLFGEFTISVHVHGSEHFIDVRLFLLRQKLGSNECVGCLLELRRSIEVLQILQRAHCDLRTQI